MNWYHIVVLGVSIAVTLPSPRAMAAGGWKERVRQVRAYVMATPPARRAVFDCMFPDNIRAYARGRSPVPAFLRMMVCEESKVGCEDDACASSSLTPLGALATLISHRWDMDPQEYAGYASLAIQVAGRIRGTRAARDGDALHLARAAARVHDAEVFAALVRSGVSPYKAGTAALVHGCVVCLGALVTRPQALQRLAVRACSRDVPWQSFYMTVKLARDHGVSLLVARMLLRLAEEGAVGKIEQLFLMLPQAKVVMYRLGGELLGRARDVQTARYLIFRGMKPDSMALALLEARAAAALFEAYEHKCGHGKCNAYDLVQISRRTVKYWKMAVVLMESGLRPRPVPLERVRRLVPTLWEVRNARHSRKMARMVRQVFGPVAVKGRVDPHEVVTKWQELTVVGGSAIFMYDQHTMILAWLDHLMTVRRRGLPPAGVRLGGRK